VGCPAHWERYRPPGAPGALTPPPSPSPPGSPGVPPSVGPPDGSERGRALLAAQNAPGLGPPGPRSSRRHTSPPSPSATDYRSVRRNRSAHVSITPRPTTPASRPADGPASWVSENVGRTSGPRRQPGSPTDTSRPSGEAEAWRGRSRPPAGAVHGPSANAGGRVRAASSSLLTRWGKGTPAYADAIDLTTLS
jgi:hypothetical protein